MKTEQRMALDVLRNAALAGHYTMPEFVVALCDEVLRLERFTQPVGGLLSEIDFLTYLAKVRHEELAPGRDFEEWLVEERNMWMWLRNNPAPTDPDEESS